MNGYSDFVMKAGMDERRRQCNNAWCKALDLTGNKEVKSFIISQLQIMGTPEGVSCLASYLTDSRLCEPAARALVTINSPESGKSLLNALDQASGQQLLSVAQALGDIRNVNAVESLTELVNTQDNNIRKVALYALANIGLEQSGSQLYEEAKKTAFRYEPAGASSAYLLWIDRMGEGGATGLVKKQTEVLISNCTADNQVPARTEALALLVKYTGEKALPRLLAAADISHAAYRNAALKLSEDLPGEKVTSAWIKKAGKLKDQPKSEVITMLGNRGDQSAFSFIVKALSDPSKQVRMAAVPSAQKLVQAKALPHLLEFMKKADADEIQSVKQALLSMHGTDVVPVIGKAIPQMQSSAKIAMIEVLAARRAKDHLSLIQDQIYAGDPAVKSAAIAALSSLVSEKDLAELFKLLAEVDQPEDINGVQKAVISALQGIEPKDKKSGPVIQEMNKSRQSQQTRFYPILRDIGGDNALAEVMKAFSKDSPEIRQAAFKALSGWHDAGACRHLYGIFTGQEYPEFADSAFNAYVKLVMNSGYPADQQLLLLRKAMETSSSTEQKSLVLNELAKVKTFSALVFTGEYLDDPLLQSMAASTVMRIALADTSLTGSLVTGLLHKAMDKLRGSESDYEREAIRKHLFLLSDKPGYVSLFNGWDLSGWKGLVENPLIRAKMAPNDLAKKQLEADNIMRRGWIVQNGFLIFTGNGDNLCTSKSYGDFEMLVDWKISPNGDAGIYLRGSPQVQIWDASRLDTEASVGSGGLFNNEVNEKNPLRMADNPVGEWNTFRIRMVGERVTVYLNGQLVVDNTILENYWDRSLPIFPVEQIELQAHGSLLAYRDIYIREIPRPEPFRVNDEEKTAGFQELFDGISMSNWTGNTIDYRSEDGCIVFHPNSGGSGNLYTREEYGDFIFRFDFQLTPAGNSGIGVRTSMKGDAAYGGMEIQVLDDVSEVYKNIEPYQAHGSVYGVIPAKRGYLKPVGEWNSEEIMFQGSKVKVILNGTVIVDGDIEEASKNGTMDHKEHPGLKNKMGHIGFLSHDSPVKFRNIRIKVLD
jgi:HEAT repeat protein